jgi:hypothetical protein
MKNFEKVGLTCLYRISDASNPEKMKVNGIDKLDCLKNFIQEFSQSEILVFADNCSIDTLEKLNSLNGIRIIITPGLGNSKSFRFILEWAFANLSKNDFVYLIEDDYYHLPNSYLKLKEGLGLADYITLYDHPDKYTFGLNPYNDEFGEPTRILIRDNSYWKITNSTTMTFATSVGILYEDRKVWEFITRGNIPRDFLAFQILTKQKFLFKRRYFKNSVLALCFSLFRKKRILISPLPSYSSHLEKDWITDNVKNVIEIN